MIYMIDRLIAYNNMCLLVTDKVKIPVKTDRLFIAMLRWKFDRKIEN